MYTDPKKVPNIIKFDDVVRDNTFASYESTHSKLDEIVANGTERTIHGLTFHEYEDLLYYVANDADGKPERYICIGKANLTPQVIIHHVARLTQIHIDDIYFLRDDDKEFSIFFKNGKRNEVISTSKSNCYVSDEYFTVYKRCSHYFPDDLIVWDKDIFVGLDMNRLFMVTNMIRIEDVIATGRPGEITLNSEYSHKTSPVNELVSTQAYWIQMKSPSIFYKLRYEGKELPELTFRLDAVGSCDGLDSLLGMRVTDDILKEFKSDISAIQITMAETLSRREIRVFGGVLTHNSELGVPEFRIVDNGYFSELIFVQSTDEGSLELSIFNRAKGLLFRIATDDPEFSDLIKSFTVEYMEEKNV